MTLAEIVQLVQSISVILAAFLAVYGFDAWRREHIGKRRIELAEDVLALFYQASDAINQMRSPFGFAGEGGSRKQSPNENPNHKQALDSAYVLIERYGRHSELFAKLHAIRYRFMAQIGTDKAAPFDAINKIVDELIVSAHEMARISTFPAHLTINKKDDEKYEEDWKRVHGIYYASGDEKDPIAPRVKDVIAQMEDTCRGIIDSKGTLFSFINTKLRVPAVRAEPVKNSV